MIEDEMVGWHHQLNGHEFEETLGYGEGQGSLACCILWGCKEWDTTATEQQMETLIRCGLWTQGGMNRKSKEALKMVKYMLP